MRCNICGRESRFSICHDCEYQVRDYFINAIASSADWMDISVEEAMDLTEFVVAGIIDDSEAIEDVKNELRWRKTHGEVTKDPKRTEGE